MLGRCRVVDSPRRSAVRETVPPRTVCEVYVRGPFVDDHCGVAVRATHADGGEDVVEPALDPDAHITLSGRCIGRALGGNASEAATFEVEEVDGDVIGLHGDSGQIDIIRRSGLPSCVGSQHDPIDVNLETGPVEGEGPGCAESIVASHEVCAINRRANAPVHDEAATWAVL